MAIDLNAPDQWATTTNYATGPEVGTPSRVDPGSGIRAAGFVPGQQIVSQHVNFELGEVIDYLAVLEGEVRAARARALFLHRLQLDGETIDDTTDGIAAYSANEHFETVVIKANTNGVLLAGDAELFGLGGTLAAITGNVAGEIRVSFSNHIVFGDGGVYNAFTSNNGSTWTAGGSTGFLIPPVAGAMTDFSSLARANLVNAAADTAWSSNGGVAWTAPSAPNRAKDFLDDASSVACLAGGIVVVCGLESGDVAFARSVDGGQTFAAASGTVAAAATMSDAGWVVGNNGTEIYHAGRRNVQFVDISVSTNGNTWTTRSTVQSIGTVTGVKLMLCQNTGLLVLAMALNTGVVELRASLDLGQTWTGPSYAPGFALTGFAVASGRLYATKGAQVFSSGRIL